MSTKDSKKKKGEEKPLTRLDIIRMGMQRARSVNEKKNGRPYGVDNAEELEALFDEYVATIQRAPKYILTKQSKDAPAGLTEQEKHEKIDRPLTEAGFCLFCGHTADWLTRMIQTLKGKERNELEQGLYESAMRVHDAIRNDLVDGGLLGQYQSNFTARLLGLADKQQVSESLQQVVVVKSEEQKQMFEEIVNSGK